MPIRYKMTKHNINNYTWIVLWTNQYGEGCSEYFDTEREADNFMQGTS